RWWRSARLTRGFEFISGLIPRSLRGKRLEGWSLRTDVLPSFETRALRAPPGEGLPAKKGRQKTMKNPPPLPEDRIPVIVGVGEIVDRPKEIAAGLEPLTLLEQALRRAEQDSGGKLLGEIGSPALRQFLAWQNRLARHRQFPGLALSRPREAAGRAPRHPPRAPLLRPGRR